MFFMNAVSFSLTHFDYFLLSFYPTVIVMNKTIPNSAIIIAELVPVLTLVVINVCTILEILCFILFLYKFFVKTSTFASAYYYILAVGYFYNIISTIVYDLDFLYITSNPIKIAFTVIQWYTTLFAGPWNTVLALNRFTGLFLWKQHAGIWAGFKLFGILAIIILYPFAVNGYVIFNFECLSKFWFSPGCAHFSHETQNATIYSNAVHALLGLGLGLAAALGRKLCKFSSSQAKKSYETPLLIQSIISSILFCCNCITNYAAVNFIKNAEENLHTYIVTNILIFVTNATFMLFHCSSTILLFCLSKMVRKSFIDFYRLNIFSKMHQSAVANLSSTNQSSTPKLFINRVNP